MLRLALTLLLPAVAWAQIADTPSAPSPLNYVMTIAEMTETTAELQREQTRVYDHVRLRDHMLTVYLRLLYRAPVPTSPLRALVFSLHTLATGTMPPHAAVRAPFVLRQTRLSPFTQPP